MRKLILIFAILVILAGGTIGSLKWMELGPFQIKGAVNNNS